MKNLSDSWTLEFGRELAEGRPGLKNRIRAGIFAKNSGRDPALNKWKDRKVAIE